MANIYKNAKLDLTTNTVVTLYTVPSDSRAIIKSILVSDDSSSGSSITVDLFDGNPAGGASKFNLFKTKAISGNQTVQLIEEPLIMMESEVIQVTATDANRLHVVASILEINRNDQ